MGDELRDECGVLYRAIRCPLTESERNARRMMRLMLYGGGDVCDNNMDENPCAAIHPPPGTGDRLPVAANFPPDHMRLQCAKICGKHMYAALP